MPISKHIVIKRIKNDLANNMIKNIRHVMFSSERDSFDWVDHLLDNLWLVGVKNISSDVDGFMIYDVFYRLFDYKRYDLVIKLVDRISAESGNIFIFSKVLSLNNFFFLLEKKLMYVLRSVVLKMYDYETFRNYIGATDCREDILGTYEGSPLYSLIELIESTPDKIRLMNFLLAIIVKKGFVYDSFKEKVRINYPKLYNIYFSK
jgi:hypothetical protein